VVWTFVANPTIKIDNATVLIGGNYDNVTSNGLAQITGDDLTFTFNTSGADGGYQSYFVTLDNNSELDNWQLNPSLTEQYMSTIATYTLPSASAVANDNLSFVVFAKTNSGKFIYGAGANDTTFNLILKDEAVLVAVDSTTYKIAVDDLKVAGYN